MGKKSKKGAKSKKSVKSNKTAKSKKSSRTKKENKKKQSTGPKIDPDILKDLTLKDFFRFPNGDVYVGEFTLTKEGTVVRHGKGRYFCSDGHRLTGQWQDNVLVDAERITFPQGSWYRGPLEGGRYSGVGTYHIPHLGTLEGSFVEGRPEGQMTLIDIKGFKWQGHVINSSLCLAPRNHLFDSEDKICKELTQKKSNSSQPKSKTSINSFISKMESVKSTKSVGSTDVN